MKKQLIQLLNNSICIDLAASSSHNASFTGGNNFRNNNNKSPAYQMAAAVNNENIIMSLQTAYQMFHEETNSNAMEVDEIVKHVLKISVQPHHMKKYALAHLMKLKKEKQLRNQHLQQQQQAQK